MEEAALRGRMVEQLRLLHDDANYILSNVTKLPLVIAARYVDYIYATRVLLVARMRIEADILEFTCEKPPLSQFFTSNSVSLNTPNDCNGPAQQNLKGAALTGGSSIFGGPVSSHAPFQPVRPIQLSQDRESQPIAESSPVEDDAKNLPAKTDRNLTYTCQNSSTRLTNPALSQNPRENNETVENSTHVNFSHTPEVSSANNTLQTSLLRLPVSGSFCSQASCSATHSSSQAPSNPVVECSVTGNSSETNANSTAKDSVFDQQVNPIHPPPKVPSQWLKNFQNFLDQNFSPIESSVPKNSSESVPVNINSAVKDSFSNRPVNPPHRPPLVPSQNNENVQNSMNKNFIPVSESSVTKHSHQTVPKKRNSTLEDALFDHPANRPPLVPSQRVENFQNSADQNFNPESSTKKSTATASVNKSSVRDSSLTRSVSSPCRPSLLPSQHIEIFQNSMDQNFQPTEPSVTVSSSPTNTSSIDVGSLSNGSPGHAHHPPLSSKHGDNAQDSMGRNSSPSAEFSPVSISPTSTVDIDNSLEIEDSASAAAHLSYSKHGENIQEPMDLDMPVDKTNSPEECVLVATKETNGSVSSLTVSSMVSVFTQRPGNNKQTTLQNSTVPHDQSSKFEKAIENVEQMSGKKCTIWIFDKPNQEPKKQIITLGGAETSVQTKDVESQNHENGIDCTETALRRGNSLITRLKTTLQSKFQEENMSAINQRESGHSQENEVICLKNSGTSNIAGAESTSDATVAVSGAKKRGRPKKMIDPFLGPSKKGRPAKIMDLSALSFQKPFEFGWKRAVVYSNKTDILVGKKPHVYYYTPDGKIVRSSKEVAPHITNSELTDDNFTFHRKPLGLNDSSKEILRTSIRSKETDLSVD